MKLQDSVNTFTKYRSKIILLFVFCMMTTFSFLAARGMRASLAASAVNFNPGNIISDAVMSNYGSMSVEQIQQFLNSKNKCNNTNYKQYQQLKAQYPNNDWHFENGHFVCLAEERFGDGTVVGSGQTAAEIIYQAAQDYRINPQVLIVLLEKEQSLITDTYPNYKQYRSATGYGCPDTAACDTKYYGFKNQVRHAAALFRDVLDNGYRGYPEKKSGVYIGYNPNSSCGRSEVYIENRATSALYRYTPYQPNAAALRAGYGTGDGCSAYGNRNFYLYFTDWFGSTQVSVEGTEAIIPDGTYNIASKINPNKVFDIAGANKTAGANANLWEYIATAKNQKFTFTRNPKTGYYTITDTNSGLVLDVQDGLIANHANLQTWANNGSCAQQWKIYRTPDGYYTFESACMAGMVLDAAGGYANNGTNLQLYTSNNSNAQKFSFRLGRTVDDGIYTINLAGKKRYSLDVYDASKANGANVQIWEDNSTIAQKWRVTYVANGDYYKIVNPFSNKSLDITSAQLRDGTNIEIWASHSECSQRWQFVADGKGNYSIVPACNVALALDVTSGIFKNGANIQLWSRNNTPAQLWTLTPMKELADGTYNVRSLLTQQKLTDLANNQPTNGANIQIWEDNKTTAQQWSIQRDKTTGLYTIYHQSGKALDVTNGVASNGANIQLWESNKTCAQNWQIIAVDYNSYMFISACDNNYALDVTNGVASNGANIQLWESNKTPAQKWVLTKI